MNINKKSYFVLSVKLSGAPLDIHESVDELVDKIANSVESVSIAQYSDGSKEPEKNVFSCNTEEEYREIIKTLENSTVICPTPLSRIALLHALNKWGLKLKCNWASGARIIRRYRHDYRGILPGDLNGYDLGYIFKEFLGKDWIPREDGNTAYYYVQVLKKVSKKRDKDIDKLINDSQEELLKNDGTGPVSAEKLKNRRNPNPEGCFGGNIIIFSNYNGATLPELHRKKVEHWAAGLGFKVKESVTKKDKEKELLVTFPEEKNGYEETGNMKKAIKYSVCRWGEKDFEKLVLREQASEYRQDRSA